MLVLPTALSPMITTLTSTSYFYSYLRRDMLEFVLVVIPFWYYIIYRYVLYTLLS